MMRLLTAAEARAFESLGIHAGHTCLLCLSEEVGEVKETEILLSIPQYL